MIARMRELKLSRYNFYIRAPKEHVLIYNALSSATVVVDPDEWRTLKTIHRGSPPPDEKFLETVLRFRMLIDDRVDEYRVFRTMHHMARFSDESMTITIAPTMACNFLCDYCFQSHARSSKKMDEKVRDAVVELIRGRAKTLKSLGICWYGGEPVLAWGVIRDLTCRVREICEEHLVALSAMMVTNGYALTIPKIKEFDALSIGSVQITLDGPAAIHDERRYTRGKGPTYATIIRNIKNVIRYSSARVAIRVNIDQRNQSQIDELMGDLAGQGINLNNRCGVYFAPVDDCSPETDGVQQFMMKRKEYYSLEDRLYRDGLSNNVAAERYPAAGGFGNCAAVRKNGIVILPDGDLHKCWNEVSFKERRVGNLLERRVIPDSNMQQWMSWEYPEMCNDCKVLPLCVGSCPLKDVRKEDYGGDIGNARCRNHRYNIRDNLRAFAERRKYGFQESNECSDCPGSCT